jgi:hypothetical protein
VLAGKRLLEPQETARLHTGGGRRVASIITHERQPLASCTLGALAVDGHLDGLEPLWCRAAVPRIVTHTRLGLPLDDPHDGEPALACTHACGHREALPLMGLGGAWFAPSRRPLGLQLQRWGNQEVGLPQPSQPPLLVDRVMRHDREGSPETALAPARGLGLERPDAQQPLRLALDDPQGPWPRQARSVSLLFHSQVSSPTSCLRQAFSGCRRASFRVR